MDTVVAMGTNTNTNITNTMSMVALAFVLNMTIAAMVVIVILDTTIDRIEAIVMDSGVNAGIISEKNITTANKSDWYVL